MSQTQLSADEIIAALHNNHYSIAERVAFLRALRDTTPGLVAIDPRLEGRIRAARAIKPEHIDTTVNALENSELWQQSAAVTPKEIRADREFADTHKLLLDEARAFVKMLMDSIRYYHFAGVEKCRVVFNAGRGINGEAALTIKPHLDQIAETRKVHRRKPDTSKVAPKQ